MQYTWYVQYLQIIDICIFPLLTFGVFFTCIFVLHHTFMTINSILIYNLSQTVFFCILNFPFYFRLSSFINTIIFTFTLSFTLIFTSSLIYLPFSLPFSHLPLFFFFFFLIFLPSRMRLTECTMHLVER